MKFSQRKIDKEREGRVRYILDAIYAAEGIPTTTAILSR